MGVKICLVALNCLFVVFLTAVMTAPTTDKYFFCATHVIKGENQTSIGRCNTYNQVDYDESREPKMIMTYHCDPVCTCCALSPYQLFTNITANKYDKYVNAYMNYACIQKNTTIMVKYKHSAKLHEYTFPSHCLCADQGKQCR